MQHVHTTDVSKKPNVKFRAGVVYLVCTVDVNCVDQVPILVLHILE